MDVSIIICTRNRASDLSKTLHSIGKTKLPTTLDVELMVVDNGSTDHTQEVISRDRPEGWTVRTCVETRGGLSHARNCAVRNSRGNILLFTDDDVRVPELWIDPITQPIRSGEADAVAGGVSIAPYLRRSWMSPRSRSVLADTCLLNPDHPKYMVGANMAIARRVFERVPSFDPELGAGAESLGFGEEYLFSCQARQAGFTIGGRLDVAVEHHFNADRLTRESYLNTVKKQGRSEAYIDHHWRHGVPESHQLSVTRALVKAYGRLGIDRIRNWRDVQRDEGMAVWEMHVLTRIYRLRQYLQERNRLRNYELKGCVKVRGVAPESPTAESRSASVKVVT